MSHMFNPLNASVGEIIAELVRVPGLNPDAVPNDPNSGEGRLAELLAGLNVINLS